MLLNTPVSITGIASVSALGLSKEEIWESYISGRPLFSKKKVDGRNEWVTKISKAAEEALLTLQQKKTMYAKLDRSVLLAILASKNAFVPERHQGKNIGINIGSSRGATQLFEKYHSGFLKTGKVSAYTSPTTTLGNISSWAGQELGVEGIRIGHSVTCSTALHALLNGIAWLGAEMADVFIAGGSEAALTPFTIAQLKAMKLYSDIEDPFACESMLFQKKKNSIVLGEGAAVAILEKGASKDALAIIKGYGFATERLQHGGSITEEAACLQRSMKMALKQAGLTTVDVLIMHAPGTIKGDLAEKRAVEKVFGTRKPFLTSNKWMVGHTFAASGMLSIEMGVLMLQQNRVLENPFFSNKEPFPSQLKIIMISAVGFGGNAVSIIISKPGS